MVCHHCQEEVKRHGKDRNGHQRYRCPACGRTFGEDRPRPLGAMRIPMDKACQVAHQLLEGSSVRSTERLTGIDRNTILALLAHVGRQCKRLTEGMFVDLCVDDVEVDEVWSFIQCKEKTRERLLKGLLFGDAYTFVGIERTTKLVIAWHLGKRTPEDAQIFADKLSNATAGRFQLSTDGFMPYRSVMPKTFGARIDYMQIIKVYGSPDESERRKYSPPTVIEVNYEPISGQPKIERVCTSIVERSNLSTRMSTRRFTRLTNAFSKKWENHGHALALWFAYYNLCRKHMTLKTTPAVASGLAAEPWTIRELLERAAEA